MTRNERRLYNALGSMHDFLSDLISDGKIEGWKEMRKKGLSVIDKSLGALQAVEGGK